MKAFQGWTPEEMQSIRAPDHGAICHPPPWLPALITTFLDAP